MHGPFFIPLAAPKMWAGQLVERVIPRAVCARGICFFSSRVNANANHN